MNNSNNEIKISASGAKIITSGFLWSFGERISAQLITLLVTVVLARLLSPEEYAIIAIVNILITIANEFVTSGLGNSLIQKKDADETDFSTILIVSLLASLLLYAVIFFSAPAFSRYYNMEILCPVLRVMGVKIVISSVTSVQQAYISRTLSFKKFFFSTIIGTAISAVIGIWMAYKGFGVWALVAQYLSNSLIDTIVLSFTSGWKCSFKFKAERIAPLFSYGWKLLVSNLLGTLYEQFQGVILSKKFSPTSLSYFNQGEKYPGIFIHNIEASLHKVMFPVISREQNDLLRVKELTRKSLSICFFLICPCLVGMAGCGEKLILILLTDKWLECVPYLQIMCLTYLFNPVMSAHTRMLKAIGKSKNFMFLTFARYGFGFAAMMVTLFFSDNPYYVVASGALTMLFICILCGILSNKIIRYSFIEQISDIFRPLIISLIMYAAVRFAGHLVLNMYISLIVQIIVGCVVYVVLSLLFNAQTIAIIKTTLKTYRK